MNNAHLNYWSSATTSLKKSFSNHCMSSHRIVSNYIPSTLRHLLPSKNKSWWNSNLGRILLHVGESPTLPALALVYACNKSVFDVQSSQTSVPIPIIQPKASRFCLQLIFSIFAILPNFSLCPIFRTVLIIQSCGLLDTINSAMWFRVLTLWISNRPNVS